MPRGKVKTAVSGQSSREKSEEPENEEVPNLSMYKFEKKPHIKIEFEKDSPEKDNEESKGLWEPANWKEFLINLRNMRSNNDAPVDTMGCHKAMDENASPKVMRYQSLIALMLSSQTKDQVTFAAMERLKEKGLTVDNVLNLSDEELGKLIYPVGFWKTKVRYIKKTTQTLKDQYDGDIPDSVDKLCKLTGVGPKMAHICMQVAWNKTTGIGVDTHVHRISNRIGWVKKPTATPEDTRKALQSWIPYDLWSEVNHLMVGFGQTICQPINPMCHECLNNDICPSSGKVGRKSPNKKSPLKQKLADDMKQELISPIKEENTVSPTKRKVTPRKDLSESTDQVKAQSICVNNTSAPSRKRKVTPKKEIEVATSKVGDVQQLGTELSVPLSTDKKRISPKRVNKVDDDSMSVKPKETLGKQRDEKTISKSRKKHTDSSIEADNINNASNVAVKLKKSPNKRKAPTSEENIEPNTTDDNQDTITMRKTRTNKESASTKTSKLTNIATNTQVKRKSPRNKS